MSMIEFCKRERLLYLPVNTLSKHRSTAFYQNDRLHPAWLTQFGKKREAIIDGRENDAHPIDRYMVLYSTIIKAAVYV